MVGTPTGPVTRLPMRHRGEVVGTLRVTARPGETSLPTRDAELLAIVCDQVAPAVAALRLSDRLQQSRSALVTAREEERRRLRRDLHDGVGAALAGIRLQVETARDLVTDPVAGSLLQSAAAGVATAVDDVRAITDDLRPAVLDDLGLEAGLRGLALRMATPATAIDVNVDVPGPLPAAVEVACYRIVAEALANAIRHAGASRVTVQLGGTATWVSLQVEDDGIGLSGRPSVNGLGLPSMRQRAEEIGGRLEVTQHRIRNPHSRRAADGGPMTRILLVDDHPLFLDGVRAALMGADDLEVVGEAHDGLTGIALAAELEPDVVLMDLNLPDLSGVDATGRILATAPDTRVLMMTMSADDDAVVAAMRAGARGYVVKGAGREDLLHAIRTVAAGGAVFSPTVADRLGRFFTGMATGAGREAFPQLTGRELEVLDLLARGLENRRIARTLHLSDKTVRNHVSNVLTKLGVEDRSEAVARARAAGLGS